MSAPEYCLEDIVPSYISDEVHHPDAPPRQTQTSIGKYLVPQRIPKGTSKFPCRGSNTGTAPKTLQPICDEGARREQDAAAGECVCESISPPWWHSPPFFWKGDLSNPTSPLGDINDYALMGTSAERAKPADMIQILQIDHPDRYIPGQIYRLGLQGIGDECTKRHEKANQKTLARMGICPAENIKLSDCTCKEPVPEEKIKIENVKPKPQLIPFCSTTNDDGNITSPFEENHSTDKPGCVCVSEKAVVGRKKHSCCPGFEQAEDKELEKVTPANANVSNSTNVKRDVTEFTEAPSEVANESRPWLTKQDNVSKNKDICPCADKKNHGADNVSGQKLLMGNKCGSEGEIVRPCNMEPYHIYSGDASQSCRDFLREDELTKVGTPFKSDACKWYNSLFPPLRVMPIGRSSKKVFPHLKISNL